MNKAIRTEAIQALTGKWINLVDDGTIGQWIGTGNAIDLKGEIAELLALGRSTNWKNGIHKWLDTINMAVDIIARDLDMDKISAWNATDKHFAAGGREEFITTMKWAILQGNTYAYIAA